MASSSSIKAMAELAHRRAEDKFLANDFAGARFQAHKASILCSSLPGIGHMVAALDVLAAAATRKLPSGDTDWFSVLGVDPLADLASARRRFLALCLLTHPDKNSSAAAGPAFDVVKQAWNAVSASLALASTASPASGLSGGGGTRPSSAKAKKRAAPAGERSSCSRASSAGVKCVCPHCHVEFSTWSRDGITVLMECPACDGWVPVQPQQEKTTSSRRPLKKQRF